MVRLFRMDSDVVAVSAAILILRHVDVAAAAGSGIASGWIAVQHAISAQTLRWTTHDRLRALILLGPDAI